MDLASLHGNWIDFMVVAILLFCLWEGLERGLILGLIDLTGFFVSFLSALKLYPDVGHFLILNFSLLRGIANAVGFLAAGFSAQILYTLIVTIVYRRIPKTLIRAPWNHWFGFIPSIGSGIIFSSFLLTLFISLPIRGVVKADILSSKIGSPLVRQTQGVEKQLRNIFGEAVNDTLTFLTIPATSEEYIPLNFTQKELSISEKDERAMLILVNEERAKVGLKSLVVNQRLTTLAQTHAQDMFERGYFSHNTPEGKTPFDRMEVVGIRFQAAGENLALAPSVQLAHQGLMNSEGHRKNILSPEFRQVGIGVLDGGIYGLMFVQEFTD